MLFWMNKGDETDLLETQTSANHGTPWRTIEHTPERAYVEIIKEILLRVEHRAKGDDDPFGSTYGPCRII